MSLSAPFLAAAKREVIVSTELMDPGSNSGCSANGVLSANIVAADADALYAIQNLFPSQPKFLTIIAWPRAIPESEYSFCYLNAAPIRRSKDWRYGSIDNTDFDLSVGRIYGVTVTDSSSYIARSIFFDQLINSLYGANYTGIAIALSGYNAEDKAEVIKQKMTNSGYSSACIVSDCEDNPSCDCSDSYSYPFPDSVFKNKRFILFEDHGSPANWCGATNTWKLPWFDLSYNMGDACLTNDYWKGEQEVISINMIRRGAIAYYGAVSVTFGYSSGLIHFYNMIRGMTGADHNTITLGKVHSSNNREVKKDYVFLGDPTLQLKLKQVTW